MKIFNGSPIDRLKLIIQDRLERKRKRLEDFARVQDWATCLRLEGEISALEMMWIDLTQITP